MHLEGGGGGGSPGGGGGGLPTEPEVITVAFNKVHGSMGLSIVAAKVRVCVRACVRVLGGSWVSCKGREEVVCLM